MICYLENGEAMITEARFYELDVTEYEDGDNFNGGIGKHWAGCSPEKRFSRTGIRHKGGNGLIAFASSFPGQIRPWRSGRAMK